ncbi:AAA family ATPase [Sulfuricurvum sp.]|uniref:AAA family ATPase n=1 Tax=Sulfuricurvum sp. TaxID=2025608 RepID=UPI003BAF6960
MELVYLWVENYKNIHKQGFNFSPRFKCSYDHETNQLTTDKNNDYVHIFPDNINITAIVGKNGSGKSSLFNQLLTDDKVHCSTEEEDCATTKSLWILDDNNEVSKVNCSDLSFNYNVILFQEDIDSELHTNKYNINQYFVKKLAIEDRYKVNNIAISFFTNVENLSYLKEFNFIPTHVEFEFIHKVQEKDFRKLLEHIFYYEDTQLDRSIHHRINSSDLYNIVEFLNKELESSLEYFRKNNDIKHYLYLRDFIYKIKFHQDKNSISIIEQFIQDQYSFNGNFAQELGRRLFQNPDENIFRTIIQSVNEIQKSVSFKGFEINLRNNDLEKLLSNVHRGFFHVNFFKRNEKNENIYFSDLSSGEQKFILLFSKIFYVIRKVFFENTQKFIIFLDEPDNYLHPNWQKKLLSYLIDFLSKTKILKDKKFSIYLTSHSPFILSDIPKSNILFIDNGMESNGVLHKQTFGANIHTLLSDAFFMEDGLIGELAKEKINQVYKFITEHDTNYIKTKEKAQQIINLIGEPLIQKQLQQLFDKKFEISSFTIDDEIAFLETKLDALRKIKNDQN